MINHSRVFSVIAEMTPRNSLLAYFRKVFTESTQSPLQVIGTGTYGKVFEASKDIVIKEVDSLDEDKNIQESSVRELVFLSQFSHPHIPIFKDIVTNFPDNKIRFFLEHGGISLHDWILSSEYKKTEDDLQLVVFQISSVLYYLQQLNFVHGDLKPGNIVINPETLKINVIDWGSLHFSLSGNRCSLGTQHFSSPELNIDVTEGKVELTSDVFSLGLSIKFFFTHQYENTDNIKAMFGSDQKYPIEGDIKDPEFKDLCERMLEISPERRLTPYEIFFAPVFDKFRLSGTQLSDIYTPHFNNTIVINQVNKDDEKYDYKRQVIIDWIYEMCQRLDKMDIFVLTIWIMDKYLISLDTVYATKKIQLSGLCSLNIADCILHNGIPIDTLVNLCNDSFSSKRINNLTWKIIIDLRGDLYRHTFEKNIDPKFLEMKYVKYVCMQHTLIGADNKILMAKYQEFSINNDLIIASGIREKFIRKADTTLVVDGECFTKKCFLKAWKQILTSFSNAGCKEQKGKVFEELFNFFLINHKMVINNDNLLHVFHEKLQHHQENFGEAATRPFINRYYAMLATYGKEVKLYKV